MTSSTDPPAQRPIRPDERTGVLDPANLARYAAHWIAPDPSLAAVVDRYWHVTWALRDGERTDQRIIDLPAVTVTIEDGDVAAPLVVTGVQSGAWRRTIEGRGRVFAIRLRPAGLAVLSALSPTDVADAAVPLTESLDARLHALAREVAAPTSPAARARAADEAIRARLAERPPSGPGQLANAALDELRERLHRRTGRTLAQHLGVSERTVQRALVETLGHGPKWVSRRLRLQAVAAALATRPDDGLATLAAELGYADQSHLTADFRSVTGITPGTYRARLAALRSG